MSEQDARPLPQNDGARVTGACAIPPPSSEDLLLEDFEDGDHQLFKTFRREGWWFSASDGTEAEAIAPPKEGFRPILRPEEEATKENQMAAHLIAPEMTDWGVSWGATVRWVQEGLECPFNASEFSGFEFWAKGPAKIVVKVGTSATVPPEFGGVCEQQCWDMHHQVVRIGEGWQQYVVRFDKLQQGGWGTDARFEPERLLSLNFTAGPAELPVDFWLDDLRFLRASRDQAAPPVPSSPASSNPTAAGVPTGSGDRAPEGEGSESER